MVVMRSDRASRATLAPLGSHRRGREPALAAGADGVVAGPGRWSAADAATGPVTVHACDRGPSGPGDVAGPDRAAHPTGAVPLVPGAVEPPTQPCPAGLAVTTPARRQLPAAVRPAAEPEPGADQDAAKSDHGTVDTRTDGRTDRGSDRLRITSRS